MPLPWLHLAKNVFLDLFFYSAKRLKLSILNWNIFFIIDSISFYLFAGTKWVILGEAVMTTEISVGPRWDPITQQEVIEDYECDGGNSSSRLFERSRIKALAGTVYPS